VYVQVLPPLPQPASKGGGAGGSYSKPASKGGTYGGRKSGGAEENKQREERVKRKAGQKYGGKVKEAKVCGI